MPGGDARGESGLGGAVAQALYLGVVALVVLLEVGNGIPADLRKPAPKVIQTFGNITY